MTGANYVQMPPQALVVAIQFYVDDEHRALRLARLLADIEPARRDDVMIAFARRFDCPASNLLQQTFMHVGKKFGVIDLPSRREGVGHPAGCNELWSSTMEQLSASWHAGNLSACSVFVVEPDGAPLSADWIARIQAEHQRAIRAGKRVSGCLVESPIPHVNGTLMAHLSTWRDRLSLHRTPPAQAWDLFHAAVLMAECQPTPLIKNVYGARGWSADGLAAMAKETAWLASTKDDSAIAWAERTLVARAAPPATNIVGRVAVNDAPPPKPAGPSFESWTEMDTVKTRH